MGRLLIFGATPAAAGHREAIEAIAATRAEAEGRSVPCGV